MAAEARGGVRCNPALLIHDQADAVGRHSYRLRQSVDADLLVLHVFHVFHVFEQNPAGVDRRCIFFFRTSW